MPFYLSTTRSFHVYWLFVVEQGKLKFRVRIPPDTNRPTTVFRLLIFSNYLCLCRGGAISPPILFSELFRVLLLPSA